ncbi:conserved hypothetical protein [Cyanobium sp. PCC 7001]|nr:conserved hypothetical protein [Cyanobium sp. PCC 7001]
MLLVAGLACPLAGAQPAGSGNQGTPSLSLAGQRYWLRWARAGQHEFTPAGQEDLRRWSEMVTLWRYPGITAEEQLAAHANHVLAAYRQAGARILRTASLPRKAGQPAEHLIVARFQRPGFSEFAATRLLLHQGQGVGLIYGRRFYGPQAAAQLGAWVPRQAAAMEAALLQADGPALLQAAAP